MADEVPNTMPRSAAAQLMLQAQTNAREAMRQQLLNHIAKVEDVLKDAFARIDADDVSTIPEPLFVKYYLPLFCGELQRSEDPLKAEKIRYLLDMWVRIARNVFRAVAIIDQHGNKVAFVPPLQDRNTLPVTPDRQDRQALDSIFTEAINTSQSFPHMGHQQIVNALYNRFSTRVQTDTRDVLRKDWEVLLARYGKTLDGGSISSVPAKNNGSELNYDDVDI